jgi:hypothetical protein
MDIWEASDELRIATAQRRWAQECRGRRPALADRLHEQRPERTRDGAARTAGGDESHHRAAA